MAHLDARRDVAAPARARIADPAWLASPEPRTSPPAARPGARRAPVVAEPGSWDREDLWAALRGTRLPRRLHAAAKFLLAHPDLVAFDSVAVLAARSGVTASAYVRLAHAVGLSGFGEMRQVLRRHLLDQSRRTAEGRGVGQDVIPGRLRPIVLDIERVLAKVAAATDGSRLEAGADLLAGASTVYLVGTRLAVPVLAFVNIALGRAGVRNVFVPSSARNEADTLGLAERRDAAICVDFSPPTEDTPMLARLLRSRGVPIVTITDDALGPTAQASTVILDVGDAQAPDVAHLAAAMALGRSLVDAVAHRRACRR